jgi:hypothetical protein
MDSSHINTTHKNIKKVLKITKKTDKPSVERVKDAFEVLRLII